eukprot:TRINITY_DN15723_c0_g1_i1.p1 TRINITY_DN15723_c0_g1~~TRINITY_DN15723_c0_g1_i1.p1  ORF type:complete len:196 (+),score=46.23 TRINITY_DN15723_c0_g1_i1:244-831(+)
MLHTLLAALLPAMVLAHTCGEINSCHDCVSTSSWWPDSKCNWCPLDTQCHADVSLVNPCAASQKIHDLPSCAISDVPSQIHIALAGGSAMSVAWFTSGSSGGEVLWGVSAPDLISTTAPERSVQYLEEYGWHHAATLHGLQWNTRYLSLIHISEPTRLLSISYAVFCLKKKKKKKRQPQVIYKAIYEKNKNQDKS